MFRRVRHGRGSWQVPRHAKVGLVVTVAKVAPCPPPFYRGLVFCWITFAIYLVHLECDVLAHVAPLSFSGEKRNTWNDNIKNATESGNGKKKEGKQPSIHGPQSEVGQEIGKAGREMRPAIMWQWHGSEPLGGPM